MTLQCPHQREARAAVGACILAASQRILPMPRNRGTRDSSVKHLGVTHMYISTSACAWLTAADACTISTRQPAGVASVVTVTRFLP